MSDGAGLDDDGLALESESKMTTKLQAVLESQVSTLAYRMQDDRESIVAELVQLSERAARYAAELKSAPDVRPSEFAKLTPELVRMIDNFSRLCDENRNTNRLLALANEGNV